VKHRQNINIIGLLILALLVLAGCAPSLGRLGAAGGSTGPTMTAIPLPTRTPTKVADIAATSLAATASPTETPVPTATPSPEATATLPPQPTLTPTATTMPTASATATATARPKVSKPQPKPTALPEFSGKLVFQTTIGGNFYTINADGTALTRITDGVDPVWSPAPPGGGTGGQQIAFTRWRDPRGVWVVNADGSGERRVFDWSEARWPSWSPDGSRILFSREHGGRTEEKKRCFWGFCFTLGPHPHWKLGVIRLADGDFREPPCSEYSLAPAWSPAPLEGGTNGTRIVYADVQGLRIQSEDGTVSYLVTQDSRDTSPAWSPDGHRLAFVRRQHDHWEIYAVDADGRNLTRLTDTPARPDGAPGNSAAPAWSPDGKYIAFLTDRTGKWEIWVMKAGGSGQKPMFATALRGLTLEYGNVGDRAISWTR
jgi:hypothetical protein